MIWFHPHPCGRREEKIDFKYFPFFNDSSVPTYYRPIVVSTLATVIVLAGSSFLTKLSCNWCFGINSSRHGKLTVFSWHGSKIFNTDRAEILIVKPLSSVLEGLHVTDKLKIRFQFSRPDYGGLWVHLIIHSILRWRKNL